MATQRITTAFGLAILSKLSDDHPYLRRVVESASAFDRSVTDYVASDWHFDPIGSVWLAQAFQSQGLGGFREILEVLPDFSDLEQDGQRSLTAALVRGIAPRSGFATVPLDYLFNPEELRTLSELRPHHQSHFEFPALNTQTPGRPTNYRGFICAIMKLTRACNLRCAYCKDWREGSTSTMTFDTLARAIHQVFATDSSVVQFIWHGGEPLLLGTRRLLRFLALQEFLAPPGVHVLNHIQSNGTLMKGPLREFIKVFGLKISVSIDGIREVHDRTRVDTHNRPTWDRVSAGIEALSEDGALSGVLVVVSPELLDAGVVSLWDHLQDIASPAICLLPQRPPPGEICAVTKRAYADFLVAAERERMFRGLSTVIREAESIRSVLSGQHSGFCELGGNCVGHFISIDWNGEVSHCDKYIGDENYVVGNINSDQLPDILAGPRVQGIRISTDSQLAEMADCKWYSLCQGWCPHERYVDSTYKVDRCCGLSSVFAAFDEDLHALQHPRNS